MGNQIRRDFIVVADQVGFRVAVFGPEDFVEVGELNAMVGRRSDPLPPSAAVPLGEGDSGLLLCCALPRCALTCCPLTCCPLTCCALTCCPLTCCPLTCRALTGCALTGCAL